MMTDVNGKMCSRVFVQERMSWSNPARHVPGWERYGWHACGTTTQRSVPNVVLAAGVDGVDNNFGELTPVSISGYVYRDTNNDGSRSSEAGIASASVTLSGTDDLGNAVSASTITDANGYYGSRILRPGTYTLTETQPAGYLDGKDTIGTPGGTPSNDQFSTISLIAGVNGIENNFGELLPASIAGYVYVDASNDG